MVKHIFDRFFSFSEPPEIRTVEGFSAVFAFVRCEHRLCSQMRRAINCATPRFTDFCKISDFALDRIPIFRIPIFRTRRRRYVFFSVRSRARRIQHTLHNLRNVQMVIEKIRLRRKIKHAGAGRYPKKARFRVLFLGLSDWT